MIRDGHALKLRSTDSRKKQIVLWNTNPNKNYIYYKGE